MKKINYTFSHSSTDFYFAHRFSYLKKLADPKTSVLLTDQHIFQAHGKKFSGWKTIVINPGESFKIQATADDIICRLIELGADRSFTLVGIGGGVITDLAGYVASVYMRGLRFGFLPTTLLALVDASIGGKNGIDVGKYKNLVGVIRQPAFILHDQTLLNTLPECEWVNGFAEVIKHACIKDASLFRELENGSVLQFRKEKNKLDELLRRNVMIKADVVQRDEFEKNERRLLNFGHTLGHALENQYELMHGQAVSIGMTYACHFSEQITGFNKTERVVRTLESYGLPTYFTFDKQKVFDVLKMDKKRERKEMNFVLLEKIGKAVVRQVPMKKLEKLIFSI